MVCGYLILYTHSLLVIFRVLSSPYNHPIIICPDRVFSCTANRNKKEFLKKFAFSGFNGGERLRCDRVEMCGSLPMFREEAAAATFWVKIR